MMSKEKQKETTSNQDQEISEFDKILMSHGLPPAEKGTKIGYSVIFTNKPKKVKNK